MEIYHILNFMKEEDSYKSQESLAVLFCPIRRHFL